MTTKERIIKRLNKGFGLTIPMDAPCNHHLGALAEWSWSISNGVHDIGCINSMTDVLKWKRWMIDTSLRELFYCSEKDIEVYKNCPEVWIEEI